MSAATKHTRTLPTYVAVSSKMLQELDLSQRSFGQNLLAKHICDFLDGNAFARVHV